MACQAKTEPLEEFRLNTVKQVFKLHDMLHGMGYRGKLSTEGDTAHIDMAMPDAVAVRGGVGSVVVYRPQPPPGTGILAVVNCMPADEFTAKFDVI